MKSLAELQEIKEKMKNSVALRKNAGTTRVIVGMGTSGIAAGARPVLMSLVDNVAEAGLFGKVVVTQSGYVNNDSMAPVVTVCEEGKAPVVYVKMDADKAKEVVEKHLKGGCVVEAYTIGAYQA